MKWLKGFAVCMVVLAVLLVPMAAQAAVAISVGFAPPPIPIYDQPIIPGPGYLWTPGYWAWGPEGYYWVPGVWVEPPAVDLLWTPGWWGWGGDAFLWNAGYWGPTVGFYGGINYGFGYGGVGFVGGRWDHGAFQYNSAVWHVDPNVVRGHVYSQAAPANNVHTSYNGGNGGVNARANAQEEAAARAHHVGPTAAQMSHQTTASRDHAQFATANGGHPPMAAMARPGDRAHVVAASGAPAHPNVAAVHAMSANAHSADEAARGNAAAANHAAAPVANRAAINAARPAAGNNARPAPANNAVANRPAANNNAVTHAAPAARPAPAPRPAPMAAPRPAPMEAPHPMAAPAAPAGGGERRH